MLTPYQKLTRRAKEIALVASANELLSWDLETYLPPKGVAFRAEQLAHLSGHTHRLFIAKKIGELISACEQNGPPTESDEAANIREWRRAYNRATKLPASLVEKFQRVRTHAREAWRQARQQSAVSHGYSDSAGKQELDFSQATNPARWWSESPGARRQLALGPSPPSFGGGPYLGPAKGMRFG